MKNKKNREANLERLRFPLLLLGTVCATAAVLTAFEWRTFDEVKQLTEGTPLYLYDNEPIIASFPEKPKPEQPKPKRIPVDELILTETDPLLNEQLDFPDEWVDDEPPFEIGFETEVFAEDTIFVRVEEMPEFPGGMEGLSNYLRNSIRYPHKARTANIQGKVGITFVIDRDGNVTDVKVDRSVGGGLDEEAVRVISQMPKWKPGKQRGAPVRVQYSIPIHFSLPR